MGCTQFSAGDPARNPAITCIEAPHIEVAANHDLNAVELRVIDERLAGFSTLLGPSGVLDLLVRLATALGELLGVSDLARVSEAQHLLAVLKRLDVRQREVARRLGVSDSLISKWKLGRMAPTVEEIEALRRVVRGLIRTD